MNPEIDSDLLFRAWVPLKLESLFPNLWAVEELPSSPHHPLSWRFSRQHSSTLAVIVWKCIPSSQFDSPKTQMRFMPVLVKRRVGSLRGKTKEEGTSVDISLCKSN
jgi:hypothetical protein